MKPMTDQGLQLASPGEDPWKCLLAAARSRQDTPPGNENAPDGFAVRVVGKWLRPVAAKPPMLSTGEQLWEALCLRGALLACTVVFVGLCLNAGTLREDINLDLWSFDSTVDVFGFSMDNL